MKKALFYTASNVSSVVQYGGIGALEGSQECVGDIPPTSCRRGATCSMRASADSAGRRVQRRAAEGRVLRVPAESIPAWRPEAMPASRLALVGDGGVPDRARPDRMRARGGLRRRTAKATFGSASPATAPSSSARSSRCGSLFVGNPALPITALKIEIGTIDRLSRTGQTTCRPPSTRRVSPVTKSDSRRNRPRP